MMCSHASRTDPGPYEENEDSVGWDEDLGLFLVADGMGGHAAGREASCIARDTFIEAVRSGVDHVESTLSAHHAISTSEYAKNAPDGIGSTLVAAQLDGSYADLVWVGDSRCYLWRDGGLTVVSHDHSFVQMLVDQNKITLEEARAHPKRNLLTQVLGMESPKPQTRRLPLQQGDWLLLCSDGLNDVLSDEEIAAQLIDSQGDLEVAAQELLNQVAATGGKDNVSVVVVKFDGTTADELIVEQETVFTGLKQWLGSPVGMGMVGAIVVFLIFAWLMRSS